LHFRLCSHLACVFFITSIAAYGGTIVVASGAGELPGSAEDLTGTPVSEIQGSLSNSDPNDVSMFALDIVNPGDFSALTVNAGPFGIADTELFLFNSSGDGVYFNDDISGSNTLSCLPSADAFNPCPTGSGGLGPLSAGTYYLAITRSANGALDGLSNEIFTNVLSTDVVGPNSGVGAIAAWDGNAFTNPNSDMINYDIVLTGTSTSTPEPATGLLLSGALIGLAALRRYLLPSNLKRRF
jgi:hypothetical protein